ncbi:MAG: proton-conducting transporter membrane subunit, partial [Verrucomicrobiae bacterium]|nr:proton-conducting transporter membrane subunit [Verrucomicrobiae bacterium]
YMRCRVAFLIFPSETALTLIAWVGGVTALMAATIAITQNDIKRILAYSTLSQLGYMIMSVGLPGITPAMFHLTTHAFFKALLFLGAGSVIHALHHEQDIWKMGGLWRKMPVTFVTFLIGTLALAGVWPLSGFYSKDEILLLALKENMALFVVGVVTAFLTAYYMGRGCFVAFFGRPRDRHAYEHAHESPLVMTAPLVFLAILSVIGGWGSYVPHFLQPEGHGAHHEAWKGFLLLLVPAAGFGVAAWIYGRAEPSDEPVKAALGRLWNVLENKYYFDEVYLWIVRNVQGAVASGCELFDRWALQRLGVGGLAGVTGLAGKTLRLLQTGNVQAYAFVFGVGLTVIIFYVVVR